MSYHNHVLINLSRTSSFSALIKPSGKFYFDQQPSQPRYHISQVKTQQPILSAFIMADRRPENQEMSRSKKQRTGELDPRANPYLAHHYEEDTEDYSNGYGNGTSRQYGKGGSSATTSLSKFKRHNTTAAQAHTAEDGPDNPFNNVPLSHQYFDILKTRRDLPVHKQR